MSLENQSLKSLSYWYYYAFAHNLERTSLVFENIFNMEISKAADCVIKPLLKEKKKI